MPIQPRMRPTFEIALKDDGTRTMARIKERLKRGSTRVCGQAVGCHAYIQTPPEQQSLLSPHLNLELRPGPSGAVLHGRFSPRPNVWTGFLAVYGASVIGQGLTQNEMYVLRNFVDHMAADTERLKPHCEDEEAGAMDETRDISPETAR